MTNNIKIENLKINYLDLNPSCEKAIVFIHGNSHDKFTFQYQYDSDLFSNYRILAIDLPGHGQSEKSKIYNLPYFSEILSQFINFLDLKNYILVGHSLGGHVALHSLEFLNPNGLFIFGTPPLTQPLSMEGFLPNENVSLVFKEDISKAEAKLLASEFYHDDKFNLDPEVACIQKTDPELKKIFPQSLGLSNFKDEIELLKKYSNPLAIVHGKNDALINFSYLEKLTLENLWKGAPVVIDGGHNIHRESAKLFNHQLINFLNFISENRVFLPNNLKNTLDHSTFIS